MPQDFYTLSFPAQDKTNLGKGTGLELLESQSLQTFGGPRQVFSY